MDKTHQGLTELTTLLLQIQDHKVFQRTLDLLLTPEEKEDLTLRFLIIKELLLQTKTQREIAKDLGVSIAKITRGSNELKRMPQKFLEQLKERLKTKNFSH